MTDQRIADLKSKIKARQGKPGFAENVEHLKAELAKLTGDAE
jgi:hypothetical protein